MRLVRTLSLGVALTALLAVGVTSGFAKVKPADHASAVAMVKAWSKYARASNAALPAVRRNIDNFTASIASSCPNVLESVNARPVENFNWPVLQAFYEEVLDDQDITATHVVRKPFEAFASKVGRLRWSKRSTATAIKRSLQVERKWLSLKTSDLCANAATLAANPDAVPPGTTQFKAAYTKVDDAAGLVPLNRIIGRYTTRADSRLVDKLVDMRLDFIIDRITASAAGVDDVFRALGLPKPVEMIRQDVKAENNARNMTSEVESCYTDTQDYTQCRTPPGTKLPLGSGPGQAEVTAATKESYTIVAHSESGTDFKIEKTEKGIASRTCSRPGVAECEPNGSW